MTNNGRLGLANLTITGGSGTGDGGAIRAIGEMLNLNPFEFQETTVRAMEVLFRFPAVNFVQRTAILMETTLVMMAVQCRSFLDFTRIMALSLCLTVAPVGEVCCSMRVMACFMELVSKTTVRSSRVEALQPLPVNSL